MLTYLCDSSPIRGTLQPVRTQTLLEWTSRASCRILERTQRRWEGEVSEGKGEDGSEGAANVGDRRDDGG